MLCNAAGALTRFAIPRFLEPKRDRASAACAERVDSNHKWATARRCRMGRRRVAPSGITSYVRDGAEHAPDAYRRILPGAERAGSKR